MIPAEYQIEYEKSREFNKDYEVIDIVYPDGTTEVEIIAIHNLFNKPKKDIKNER